MSTHSLEELEEVLGEALRRIEMIKAAQQVMCTKAGLDWDAVCFKAKKRIEAAERVSAEMEAEAERKAAKDAEAKTQ